MSYLPRMSKTYKEPQVLIEDESEETQPPGTLQPASSMAIEKTFNPQIALKHYKYQPHPPPVLPGPSVTDEANENELFREASRLKRSLSKINEVAQSTSRLSLNQTTTDCSETSVAESDKVESVLIPAKLSNIRKTSFPNPSKTSPGKKKMTHKKKDTGSKHTVNVCLVKTDVPESFVAAQSARAERDVNDQNSTGLLTKTEINKLKRENTIMTANCSNPFKGIKHDAKNSEEKAEMKEMTHRCVQCTIFGSLEKTFVIPSVINILLKSLAFILYEINKDEILCCRSAEGKRIMTQVQLILGDLCNETVEKNFNFEVTFSDAKRAEKLQEDLQKYARNIYGTKGELTDMSDELKNYYTQLKVKELELGMLQEEIEEFQLLFPTEVELKGSDLKNPEVTLQNKRLECEQLVAELEFSKMEIKKYQKILTELDWDIKVSHDQMTNLKKYTMSRSRTDILTRKPSIQKIATEVSKKGTIVKETEECRKKNKT